MFTARLPGWREITELKVERLAELGQHLAPEPVIAADGLTAPSGPEMQPDQREVIRLRIIADYDRATAITSAMAEQKLVIADGHHRYETALNYRNERRLTAGDTDRIDDVL